PGRSCVNRGRGGTPREPGPAPALDPCRRGPRPRRGADRGLGRGPGREVGRSLAEIALETGVQRGAPGPGGVHLGADGVVRLGGFELLVRPAIESQPARASDVDAIAALLELLLYAGP